MTAAPTANHNARRPRLTELFPDESFRVINSLM
jgi:hypothetical protein